MIGFRDFIEHGSAGLVFVSGGLAGHYASLGMTPVQWAGAATAVLGSITLAVAIRIRSRSRSPQKIASRD